MKGSRVNLFNDPAPAPPSAVQPVEVEPSFENLLHRRLGNATLLLRLFTSSTSAPSLLKKDARRERRDVTLIF